MSHTDREPLDRDLLADHLGGALAGTPEEARVAHLIATDPQWARAASQLAGALDAVATELGAVGPPPAMPDDVAARLDAVLRSLSPAPSTGIAAALSGAGAEAPDQATTAPHPPAPHPPAPRLSGQRPADRRPATGPPAGTDRRRRRTRWGAAVAAVTAVVAFAAVGLGPLGLSDQLTEGADDGAGEAAADAPADAGSDGAAPEELELDPAPNAERSDEGARPAMTASGLNYQPGSPLLNQAPATSGDHAAPVAPKAQEEHPEQLLPTGGAVPDELAPLWADPDPCLRAVRAEYRPAEVDIQVVDFASFERRPAVVIWLTADDQREVLVAGPECGRPAAGLDERYRAERD